MSPTDQQINEKEVAKSKELAAEEQILSLKTRNTQLSEEIESLKNMCKHYESVVSFFFSLLSFIFPIFLLYLKLRKKNLDLF